MKIVKIVSFEFSRQKYYFFCIVKNSETLVSNRSILTRNFVKSQLLSMLTFFREIATFVLIFKKSIPTHFHE